MTSHSYATLLGNAMSEARVHPPSERLLRAARQAGLFPRTELISTAAGFSTLVFCGSLWGAPGMRALAAVCRDSWAALGQPSAAPAWPAVWSALWPALGLSLVPLLAAAVVGVALRIALTGVASGSAPRFRFPRRPPRSYAARGLAALGLFGFVLHASASFLVLGPGAVYAALGRELAYLASWLLLCALVDAVFARLAFVRALHLTPRELQEDQRADTGDPALRAAREEARRNGLA